MARRQKRADDRYEIKVSLGVDTDGKRIRQSVYGRTQKEVEAAARALRNDIDAGKRIGTPSQTVGQYLESWLAGKRVSTAPNTYQRYRVAVEHLAALGRWRLDELTAQHVQDFMTRLSGATWTKGSVTRPYAPSTVAQVRNALRAALNDAVRLQLVTVNVAALATVPTSTVSEVAPPDETTLLTVLSAVHGHDLEALWFLALTAGLRQGELLGLRWADVDLDRAIVTVTGQLQRDLDHKLTRRQAKSAASRRVVPLAPFVVAALRRQRARIVGPELVFVTSNGTPYSRRNVYRAWTALLKRLGVPHCRPHDLRHAFASLLAREGLSLKEVSALLGHANIRTTAQVYTHLFPSEGRKAADAMERIFGVTGEEKRDEK